VLDVGCGTGELGLVLARHGLEVTGVDPAEASLEVARRRSHPSAEVDVRDATTLPGLEVELAVMTGNVAQVFLTNRAWTAALRGTRAALKDAGHLVLETRRPERRVWEEWPLRTEPVTRDVPGVGVVERRLQITAVALPLVPFRYT
jgi:SAM-dependent methyltransferase